MEPSDSAPVAVNLRCTMCGGRGFDTQRVTLPKPSVVQLCFEPQI